VYAGGRDAALESDAPGLDDPPQLETTNADESDNGAAEALSALTFRKVLMLAPSAR